MAVIKCKMCGGDLNITDEITVVECEYCGSRQTIPNQDSEKKLTLFARAERLRRACEFDKAAGVYESIVADFPEEAEAYWGLVLCRYGIEYVDDPATRKKVPTCHRSSFDNILEDADFDQACENADAVARRQYREEAKAIEDIRREILAVSSKEDPYDIFICYKETGENSGRTIDSVIAQDVYDALTEKGYRVFFSRISLEDKLGTEYEPYIFAALNSAKVMLVFGTDFEYFNAVWVKNEWSRFLKLMARDKNKHLIPCYKNVDAYDMPQEFSKLQGQDMGKVGAIQDLLRGIDKILSGSVAPTASSKSLESQLKAQEQTKAENTVQLGTMALNSGDLQKAVQYYEEVIKIDSNHIGAYLGLVRALDIEKCKPYWSKLAEYELESVSKFLRSNPEMLLSQPVSLLDKAILNSQSIELIKVMLDAGSKPDDDYILYHAIVSKSTNKSQLIKLLLDFGADPNQEYKLRFDNTTEMCTPLRDVIWQIKDFELAKLLVDYGAEVNYISKSSNNESWSLLDMAVRTGNEQIVHLLLENGADANSGRWEIIRIFNDYYRKYYSALSDGIRADVGEAIVQLLLKYGADPNYTTGRSDFKGKRSTLCGLGEAILYSSNPTNIIQALLDAGANARSICYPNYCEYKGTNHYNCRIPVLDIAVEKNLKDAVKLLINAGATFDDYCILTNERSSNGYAYDSYSVQLKRKKYGNEDIESYIKQFGWKKTFWESISFTTHWE